MSKIVTALPQLRLKDSAIGGVLAMIVYVALQFLNAALIHRQILGEASLYVAVCISAGISSFVGCSYSILRKGKGGALGAAAVIAVFLLLTLAVGLLSGGACSGSGLIGVGSSMVVGGLAAAVAGSIAKEGKRGGRDVKGGRRKKKKY